MNRTQSRRFWRSVDISEDLKENDGGGLPEHLLASGEHFSFSVPYFIYHGRLIVGSDQFSAGAGAGAGLDDILGSGSVGHSNSLQLAGDTELVMSRYDACWSSALPHI